MRNSSQKTMGFTMSAPHTWPRLHVPASLAQGHVVELSREQTHYLAHVLRVQEGAFVRLFNGRDGEWAARAPSFRANGKKPAFLEPTALLRSQTPESDLWACAAPLKRTPFEFLVMKATELGVSVIQPVLTQRTQVRALNLVHLRAIATEAAEQSERLSVPEIRDPVPFKSLVDASSWPRERTPVVCAEFGAARAIGEAIGESAQSAALLTGPEGGFTPEEMETAQTLPGVLAVRLGPRILRAETAMLAALACWQALRGDWIIRQDPLP